MEKPRPPALPKFEYHPGPFGSGAFEESDAVCECCGLARGVMYVGPIRSTVAVERVCPWCIADGSAHAKWDCQFTDGAFCDRHLDTINMPAEVYDEVFHRTPGVVGALQAVHWWVHCEEPAEFVRVEDERVRFRCRVCGKRWSYHDFD